MSLDLKFSTSSSKNADTAVIFMSGKRSLGLLGMALDKKCGGLLTDFITQDKTFGTKTGEMKWLTLPVRAGYKNALLVSRDAEKSPQKKQPEKKQDDFDATQAENLGGRIFMALENAGAQHAALFMDAGPEADLFLAHAAYGAHLRAYKFLKYKSVKKDAPAKGLKKMDVVSPAASRAAKIYAPLDKVANAVYFARDLVNEPPNHLFPDSFAKRIVKHLKPLGIKVDVLDEKKMAKLGMGAALGVGQGSDFPPRMVIMRWNGSTSKSKDAKPLAFVGKGITFDTGGVSIKPAAGMEEMKMDMGGAAAVTGLMMALALTKSKANVVGIVGLAENALSGRAYRPSDILKSYSGKTIEVLNTDAEGRLVLADALSYVQKQYKPKLIIDLATLTGAMLVALGNEFCGTFSNDDTLWLQLESASKASGERLWRMPLDDLWRKEMEGSITDLQNIAKNGRNAGACTAAGFLEHFIENKTPWAHLDIAGTAWIKSERPTVPRFGTGFGVRLLHRFVQDHHA
jgi:leucyl aminopeptidase